MTTEASEYPESSEDLVKFLNKTKSFNKRFNSTQVELTFKLQCPTSNTCTDWQHEAFTKVISTIQQEGELGDKVILEIFLEENPYNKPIFLGLRPLGSLTAEAIFSVIEKVHQSTPIFSTTDILGVRAYLLHQMEGKHSFDFL